MTFKIYDNSIQISDSALFTCGVEYKIAYNKQIHIKTITT